MSNADKKHLSKAEIRARTLRRNKEIKKRRDRKLAEWISESKIDMNGELADIYLEMLKNDKIPD